MLRRRRANTPTSIVPNDDVEPRHDANGGNPPAGRMSPAVLILGATALSGASGYVVTAVVASVVSVSDYTAFAVFWSALFLVVGALGGVQHELARASSGGGAAHARALSHKVGRASRFTLVSAGIVAAVLASTAPLWAPVVFADVAVAGAGAMILGAVGYLVVAASCGLMYGTAAWRALALMISLDGIVRLIAVSCVLIAGGGIEWLFWAVSVPFIVTVIVIVPTMARGLWRTPLDVGYRALAGNTVRIVLASAATAALIAGFPVIVRASEPSAPEAVIGPLILVLTLTRAPLVIPVMAMQSYLVVRFRANPATTGRRAGVFVALVLAVSVVLAVLLGIVGPALFVSVFGPEYALDGIVIAGLVASSGFVAALAITGPALLSRSRHGAVTAGWLVAVAFLVAVLVWMPLPTVERALVSLALGPVVGLAVHVVALLRSRGDTADDERRATAL